MKKLHKHKEVKIKKSGRKPEKEVGILGFRRVYFGSCSKCPRRFRTYIYERAKAGLCGVCRQGQAKVSPGQTVIEFGIRQDPSEIASMIKKYLGKKGRKHD